MLKAEKGVGLLVFFFKVRSILLVSACDMWTLNIT